MITQWNLSNPLKQGHLFNQDTLTCPSGVCNSGVGQDVFQIQWNLSNPMKRGHLFNQDTLTCPSGVCNSGVGQDVFQINLIVFFPEYQEYLQFVIFLLF